MLLRNMLPERKVENFTMTLWTPRHLRHALLFFCALPFLGMIALVGLPAHADDNSEHIRKLNGGYYLLHQLSDDESQLPLLLTVKHAPAEIGSFADEISKTGKETVSALDRLQESNPAIRLDQNPLPAIERETRDSIKDDKQHQLLFGTKDSEFVRCVLVSQIEASTYAKNLASVLADQETSPDRSRALRQISARWDGIRNKTYRILRNY